MTDKQKQFIADIQDVLNEHKACLEITDDGKPYGEHHGVVEIHIMGEGTFNLPTYMDYDQNA